MENNEDFNFGNLKIVQFGYVYKNIEKHAKLMENIFKIPKFSYTSAEESIVNYRGKECKLKMRSGLSRMAGVQIELHQLIKGDNNIYKEFLDEGKEGLHHVAFLISESEPLLRHLEKNNIGIIQSGFVTSQAFYYMDTYEQFGIIMEFLETIRRKSKKKKLYT